MPAYTVTQPQPDVVRVAFPSGWDTEQESGPMFEDVLTLLDDSPVDVTLLIVAGDERPTYRNITAARGILLHDNLKQIIIVARDAQLAANHMGATRGERGMMPIPMLAFDSEDEALKHL